MKKGILIMMALTLFLSLGFGQYADAKSRGGKKSPKQSFTQNPKTSDKATQTNPGKKADSATATKKPGFFSGGSLMKGLFIGGIAGLLFGSLFAGWGVLGSILGLMINMLAIFAVIMLIRTAYVYFKNKRNRPDQRRPY